MLCPNFTNFILISKFVIFSQIVEFSPYFMCLVDDDQQKEIYELTKNTEQTVQDKIAKGIKISLNFEENKVRRNIDMGDEEDEQADINEEAQEIDKQEEEDQDKFFANLHHTLNEIEIKYKKTPSDIADIYVKVSGDIENLIKHIEGQNVPTWSYLEDLALTRPEDSIEFKCLLDTKGKEEIEKRRDFLLKTNTE